MYHRYPGRTFAKGRILWYTYTMKKISEEQRAVNDKHAGVVALYKSGNFTTEQVAKNYGISVRQVQRIAKKYGVIRSLAESNKLMAKHKNYKTIPLEFRVKRKQLSLRTRYDLLTIQPYCTLCGKRAEDGVRLEIDHIDNDPMNNTNDNLQVLCALCNTGKSHSYRGFK